MSICIDVGSVSNGSGLGLEPELNRCNRSYHPTTQTVPIEPVLPPKTRHFMCTILPPIKYLSFDRIVTWSVCRLCSLSRSCTSHCQIWDRTNIHGVTAENPPISPIQWRFVTVVQRILVHSQICQREVKKQLELQNLHVDLVMIQSDLKYLIGAKVAGSVIRNCSTCLTWPKNRAFMSGPGNNPVLGTRGLWVGSNPD